MKILHTSDWHLGKKIQDKDTYKGTQDFLIWLKNQIHEKGVDCLIIAGDVFDTATPTNQAKAQYYQFLASLTDSPCKSVVILTGNHDSPSFITAPKDVLKHLNVHVVGVVSPELQDEILEVQDSSGEAGAIIGVVPFFQESDIYQFSEEDAETELEPKLIEAIKKHYFDVYQRAVEKRKGRNIPIVLTGHLFVEGTFVANEEEKEAYKVGNLGQVPISIFPQEADYIALGHVHRPQVLNNDETRNYSGSPYHMNFKEIGQKKYVRLIEFPNGHASVSSLEIPTFLKLEQIEGSVEYITEKIKELSKQNEDIFLKVVVDGPLTSKEGAIKTIKQAAEGTRVIVTSIVPKVVIGSNNVNEVEDELVLEMNPTTVFEKLLEGEDMSEETKNILRGLYATILESLDDEESSPSSPASRNKRNED